MNYRKDMEKSIDFIEVNLGNRLTAAMIADYVGYSLYHYCRIFLACYGVPVMEYVRKRRLSLAALDLDQGAKVIDIALKYGFETASGFSKAFRREYNCSPTQYSAGMWAVDLSAGKDLANAKKESLLSNVRFETKESFKIAGYAIKTNISDASSTKDVAALWEKFDTAGWESKLYEQLNPLKHGEVGIFIPGKGDQVSYVLGVIVDNFEQVTEDMVCLEIPETKYAVFTTLPVNMQVKEEDFAIAIKSTWKAIFEEWFQENYEYDQSRLDFEFYDERCHLRTDSVMEIYIPIKQKCH